MVRHSFLVQSSKKIHICLALWLVKYDTILHVLEMFQMHNQFGKLCYSFFCGHFLGLPHITHLIFQGQLPQIMNRSYIQVFNSFNLICNPIFGVKVLQLIEV